MTRAKNPQKSRTKLDICWKYIFYLRAMRANVLFGEILGNECVISTSFSTSFLIVCESEQTYCAAWFNKGLVLSVHMVHGISDCTRCTSLAMKCKRLEMRLNKSWKHLTNNNQCLWKPLEAIVTATHLFSILIVLSLVRRVHNYTLCGLWRFWTSIWHARLSHFIINI